VRTERDGAILMSRMTIAWRKSTTTRQVGKRRTFRRGPRKGGVGPSSVSHGRTAGRPSTPNKLYVINIDRLSLSQTLRRGEENKRAYNRSCSFHFHRRMRRRTHLYLAFPFLTYPLFQHKEHNNYVNYKRNLLCRTRKENIFLASLGSKLSSIARTCDESFSS